MRGLAIGVALALILLVVPGGRFLLVTLLIPLAFFALLRYRTTWQPVARAHPAGARRPGSAEQE